jgi:PilZ domain
VELDTVHNSSQSLNDGGVPLRHSRVGLERRTRFRTSVHCPVLVFQNGSREAIESLTENLSSNGFYFHSNIPLTPGESLICAIKFPSHNPTGDQRPRILECRVQIKRVETANGNGSFGIACQIQDYRLIVGEDQPRVNGSRH